MIYLDNAATTRVYPEVVRAMLPYLDQKFSNPSSIYEFALNNKKAIISSRKIIADSIGAKENEIYFTSGGSESDNWALINVARNYSTKGKHIITTAVEHHAILNTCKYLESIGFEISYLSVDANGMVDIYELLRTIRRDTILISVMAANNEVGTIMPLKEIGQIAHNCGILFHTDAVQGFCHIPIDVDDYNIDFLSASAHKIGGPKGCGFLYVRENVNLSPLIFGGAQERHMRGGTENVPGIVGMAKATAISMLHLREYQKIAQKRDYMINRILSEIPFSRLNGHPTHRLAGNASFSFQFVNGESLLLMLDMEGVCASGGSACTTGQKTPSHVLTAMGVPASIAYGTVRFTLSTETTLQDINKVIELTKRLVEEMREKSSEYQKFINYNN